MQKAERLFEIVQILRAASAPVTAATMAAELKVVPRSIYRDIDALRAMRVPVEGGRGIGYVLRKAFSLPPLMLSIEESEAITLALALLDRSADTQLRQAASSVSRKIAAALPAPLRPSLDRPSLHAWGGVAPSPEGIDLAVLRRGIREETKLTFAYTDEAGVQTQRVVRPLALIYYTAWTTLVAWCDTRNAIRNFRTDRMRDASLLSDRFTGEGDALRKRWMDGWVSNRA
ncbi:MAG: YafY family transcriptional regulator [Rhizobiaceae bacterium]|jgi:predicted DNA-binding transcriptional regulator YafY|nr:YafY family transcriptional regulator [Rhizobiaceae bacterium]